MHNNSSNLLNRLSRFIAGAAMIWLLIFVALPWAQKLPVINPIMEIITEADLDANQYFYTQSEETYQAESRIKFRLEQAKR
ncbi:MAG: hypothetical protein D5R98_00075 [Desulfonatronovibrio sp. MSAO_Bac4]|nr:MAG: hypothetical protein D5R98_00075 [Desulfonatronovibrio sp. MSAO_Bac4]